MNLFKHCLYAVRALQVSSDVTEMIYPPNKSDFFDKSNQKIVTNFASVLFNTQVKAIKYDGHLCTFINVMPAFLLLHNEALKGLAGESNMITVALI